MKIAVAEEAYFAVKLKKPIRTGSIQRRTIFYLYGSFRAYITTYRPNGAIPFLWETPRQDLHPGQK